MRLLGFGCWFLYSAQDAFAEDKKRQLDRLPLGARLIEESNDLRRRLRSREIEMGLIIANADDEDTKAWAMR